ncbi:uncharacterized protein LOC142584857 [Dermacentor variabilis]|uniref:uncharacterized protein LOC142584857 n=1 Tax=Dermacentor variabilis TaxID=34621 RepID=UPI003F5B8B3C
MPCDLLELHLAEIWSAQRTGRHRGLVPAETSGSFIQGHYRCSLSGLNKDSFFLVRNQSNITVWCSRLTEAHCDDFTNQETAHDDDLGDMPLTPIICMKGPGLFEAEMFTVCVDGVAILTTQRAAAFKVMFLLYFVLNIEYPPEVALTLEFVQRAIAGINPERSTKARRTSKKQYCLSPKVAALANALDQYKF